MIFKYSALLFIVICGLLRQSFGATIPNFDTSAYLNSRVANAITKSIGLGMDYRSYEPATPLGTAAGIDLSVEVTLAKPSDDLAGAIATVTRQSESQVADALTILPSARFHFHKGIGDSVDIGFSYLPPISSVPVVGQSWFVGGELKICVYQPSEGPTWSIRTSYNVNRFKYEGMSMTSKTWTPAILMSKKMSFADPYVGAGYQMAQGEIDAQISVPESVASAAGVSASDLPSVSVSEKGRGAGALVFGGLSLRMGRSGLRITLEGAYSSVAVTYFGTKIGLSF